MSIKKFGYVRVSTKDQNVGRQIEDIKKYVESERDIFIDKKSGKDYNRDQYQLVKRMLREGDVLYIHSLDRFGRNKEAILKEWKEITQDIKAHIIVLDMPLLDTTKYKDSLGSVGNLITDLVLQILSWLAEEERLKNKVRQRQGIELAQKEGRRLGRKPKEIPEEFFEAYRLWKACNITAVQAMKMCNMKKTHFYKVVKEFESQFKK
ncbi:recombinase family protein [Bacillus thuringiensis]|uniref:recombinase family protein n=1 Tax=Bacillus thuringiensis TaxID=1428 RepID=UPI0028540AB9|nr:recombinase family protein [Bacillus thuringiensis]MDR5025385.1 recombinase family protein [Bacillus thuringiensis]